MKIPALCLLVPLAALSSCRMFGDDDDDHRDTTAANTNDVDDRDDVRARGDARATEAASRRDMLGSEDQSFIQKAAYGGNFEVRSSRLALAKGVTGRTREIAEMMIRDHEKANNELMQLAQRKANPAPMGLDEKHQDMIDELSKLDGHEFEQRYMEMQAKAHDEAIALFERASEDVGDRELQAFIDKTLPTLRMHRRHVEEGTLDREPGDGRG